MKPSDFKGVQPWGSVMQKSEHETVANNVMTILRRTEDSFRPVSWEEYEKEREKDGNFSHDEKSFFDDVIKYFKSEDTARLFSPAWDKLCADLEKGETQ